MNVDEGLSEIEEIKKKKNVNVIILDQKAGTFNFSIEDPSRNIPARKNTKPLYPNSSNHKG